MLQEQVIPIDFGQGIDTKTDPKLVVPGKMLRLQDCVFTNIKRISKRNGYTALGTTVASVGSLVAPALTHTYNNELLAADQGLLLSYSSSQNAWANKSNYTSTELIKYTVDQENPVSGATDCAVFGNYILYGWSTAAQVDTDFPIVRSKTLASVIDMNTGSPLVGPSTLSTSSQDTVNPVRCVLLGGTTLAIVYQNTGSTALVLRTVVFAGSGVVSFSAEVTISTNYNGKSFDIAATATGAAIVYKSTTGVTLTTISTAGAIVNTVNIVDGSVSGVFALVVDSTNGNIWIYWVNSTYLVISYSIYSSVLSLVLAQTTARTNLAPQKFVNIIAIKNSITQQTLYTGEFTNSGLNELSFTTILQSNGTVGSPTVFIRSIVPFSRTFSITSAYGINTYAVFAYRGHTISTGVFQSQPTYFAVQLDTIPASGVPLVVARFGSGLANSQVLTSFNSGIIGYTPNVAAISTTKVLFACSIELQEYNSDFYETVSGAPGGFSGAFSYTVDFNSANAYRAVNAGNLAILNGGVMQVYDGQKCTEFGFHLFPEVDATPQTTVTGAMVNGIYSYIAIFQWIDAQGNLHQSAPSLPVTVTTAGAENSVFLSIFGQVLSQKIGVSVAIYRTTASGTLYHLVTDPVFVTNIDSTLGSADFNDNLSDAELAGNPLPYTGPGSPVLENSTPPPSMIMAAHNNRLWFVDSENPNNIWYTKSFQPSVGLSPSAFMVQQIDPKYGNISALSEMDDKLIVFKQSGIFIQSGDGVNDTGTGSSLSFPQFVPSDVGCTVLKSTVLTPNGVMFKSLNGIYRLNRALGVEYIGLEVEAYNSQVITAANIMPGKSQIRFLVSSGLTLVFDYIFNKWSTFTNHTGRSATVWQDTYIYATTGANIFKEAPGVYTDNGTAYPLLLQTSWLALGGVQGFQRVRRLIMLGDYANGLAATHKIQIQAAYDFSTTFQTAVPFTFGAASSSGVFQYREGLPQQKCSTISLLIEEVTTGSALEYLDLSNISFEAGMKKGVNKMPAGQSV